VFIVNFTLINQQFIASEKTEYVNIKGSSVRKLLRAFFNFWEYRVRQEGRLSRRYETGPAASADISFTRLVNLARNNQH
jgi:hypothetical protein